MTTLSLGQAAKLANVGKTTIARAIQAGRLSASRKDDGGYSIDPAELARVYEIKAERLEKAARGETIEADDDDGSEDRDATPRDAAEDARRRLEALVLEERIKALETLLAVERERREAVEQDRDRWHDQALKATALLPPPAAPAPANDAAETKRAGLLDRLLGWRVA